MSLKEYIEELREEFKKLKIVKKRKYNLQLGK